MRIIFSEQNCLMLNQIQYILKMFHIIQNITSILFISHNMMSNHFVIQYSTILIEVVYSFLYSFIFLFAGILDFSLISEHNLVNEQN